jgi:hypothetical protein
MTSTIADIQAECDSYGSHTPEYFAKMLHKVPDAPVVEREQYVLRQCGGKRVLSLGHSGLLAPAVEEVAESCAGIDLEARPGTIAVDLDNEQNHHRLWRYRGTVNFILCGEILEHLSNPGNVLFVLREFQCPVLITVPNAFCDVGRAHLAVDRRENVNRDHVAYYSYWTLRRLVERYRFEVADFCWYKGKPLFAEGLIMLVR